MHAIAENLVQRDDRIASRLHDIIAANERRKTWLAESWAALAGQDAAMIADINAKIAELADLIKTGAPVMPPATGLAPFKPETGTMGDPTPIEPPASPVPEDYAPAVTEEEDREASSAVVELPTYLRGGRR